MADNVPITPGTGTTIAADDVGGVLHQRVKLSIGADGVATDALGGAGAVAAGVLRVTHASDDPAVVSLATIATAANDTTTPSPVRLPGSFKAVAASQTDTVLGTTGAVGDYLSHLLVIPATTSPGAVSIKDGAGSAITVFTGGASSVTSLISFPVALGATSVAGAWKVTTAANVSVMAFGKFT